ncbi:glycosyltransferase [Vibrio mytili]|uniref:Glycosyl transferase n=1 Tax=Vibrio mytili TaxID=50718 RepID=A0A0C3DFN4_9VIBR|nr:glycosyltransferase [Vibrio mytili]KIN10159.1 glycosyl transferase [Vibrio mytili]
MANTGTLLIVLYNKEISDSSTYHSLINYAGSLQTVDLLIWNNGPNEISKHLDEKDTQKFKSVTIREDLSNAGLAKIYNYALGFRQNDYCIFLDDDSDLSTDYIESVLKTDRTACAVPILTHNGAVQSPTLKKMKVEGTTLPEDRSRFRAVGSGVAVGTSVAHKLRATYGSVFDEHFLLYGVDTTFFIRLERAGLLEHLCVIPGFEHSYSRLSTEPDAISDFRKKERAYDEGLRARYYKSKSSLIVYTIRTGLKSLKNRLYGREDLEGYIFKAIMTGKHYRDKQ